MATAPLVDLLKPVCKLQVRDNWRTFVRPGSFYPVGIIVHHTGGQNDLNTVINGRFDLPGPLANLYSDRDDPFTITLISGGRCNHAGAGSQKVLDETRLGIAPSGDAVARGLIDGPNGNGYFYGFECENKGTGQPWPVAQLESMAKVCAAICRHHNWTANRVIGHREWTKRKPDPYGFNMGSFRKLVADYLAPPIPPTVRKEKDVYILGDDVSAWLVVPETKQLVWIQSPDDLNNLKAAGHLPATTTTLLSTLKRAGFVEVR